MNDDLIPDYMKPFVAMGLLNLPNVMEDMQRRQHDHEMLMKQMDMQQEAMRMQWNMWSNDQGSW